MKDKREKAADDAMRPEYTEQELGERTKGKYLTVVSYRYEHRRIGTDATEAFPTAESVNK